MRKHSISALLLASILIVAYIICTLRFDYDYISTIAATIIAGLGIFGVWLQLKKETDIKEAEFLMNFNFTFITTEKFVKMENRLEQYRIGNVPMQFCEEDRQELIDYLVYLESLAPLILNKMVRLEIIDNLFGYRFFLAVNNKEVQEFELCPESEYYRGCFNLYRVWKKYRLEHKLSIPLAENDLENTPEYQQMIKRK